MPDVIFEEIECRSALNRVSAPNLPFRWTLDPYRGGQRACAYCVAHGTQAHPGHDSNRDAESRVVVKVNAPDILRRDLSREGWARELVAIGTSGDPYQTAELKYSLTHRLLKVLRDFAHPASIITKSPHIVRDIDVLASLAAKADLTVTFSIATLDDETRKQIEPSTASPQKRLDAMRLLSASGIRCGVLLAPILPGLTDDAASIEAVMQAAKAHGASFVHDNVLFLKPGTKEWFMPILREAYPHLSERYAPYYRGAYAPRTYTQEVHRTVENLRRKHGLMPPEQVAPSAGQLQLAM